MLGTLRLKGSYRKCDAQPQFDAALQKFVVIPGTHKNSVVHTELFLRERGVRATLVAVDCCSTCPSRVKPKRWAYQRLIKVAPNGFEDGISMRR